MRRTMPWALLALLLVASAPCVHSEVAVEKAANGAYKSLRVSTKDGPSGLLHWGWDPDRPYDDYLNIWGDNHGDGAPAAVVMPAGTLQVGPTPFVVWTHDDGKDREIYYALWREQEGWSAPARLTDNKVDDRDPFILVDPRGDVRMTWWSETSPPSVWFRSFVDGRWGTTTMESLPGQDSRWPTLIVDGNKLLLEYVILTPLGSHTQSLLKDRFDP